MSAQRFVFASDVEDPYAGQTAQPSPNLTAEGVSSRAPKQRGYYCCSVLAYIVAIILLLFPVVTIPILFTLNAKSTKSSTQSSASTGTFAAVVTSSIKPLVVGTTVSLSASGALQTGGGTTIYRNVGPISASACPKFLSATPVYDDKFLVSYADGKSGQASISVMQVNSSRLGSVLASTQTTRSDLYHVVTLNQATGLFVTISQDDSLGGTPNTALIAGRSDSKNSYAITFGASAVYDQGSFSVDPTITPLSNSSFVIAYYNTSLTFAYSLVYARYGSVDATTLAITLSDPLLVVSDASYGVYASTASLTALSFMLTYYDSGGLSPVLSAQVFTVDITNPAAPVIAAITLVTTKPQSDLGYNLVKATTLDSSNVVVAYGDTYTGNGITCTLVTYDASTKTILFGSVLPIVTGSTVNNDPNLGFTSLAIVTIGGGSQFMVIFVDLSLNGAVVTAVGEMSPGGQLIQVSPNFVLNSGIATANAFHTYVSLAVSKSTAFSSHVAILTAVTDTAPSCPLGSTTDFSFMEILPKPLGIMTSTVNYLDANKYGSVALGGIAAGFSGLTPGMTYYATTSGKVITDGSLYGRSSATASNSANNGHFYVTDVVDKLIVSSDSIIGIAVASDSILLRSV